MSYIGNLRRIRREAWIVLVSSIGHGFAGFGITEAVLSLYLVRMGYGPEFVGASAAASNLGYALAAMPGAALSRRLGARRSMMLGSAGWAFSILLLSISDLVPPPWQAPWTVVARVIASAGMALYMVSSQPYLTAVTSDEERPHVFALTISLRPLGSMLGGLVGGLLPAVFAGTGGAFGSSLADPRAYGMTLAVGVLVYAPVFWVLRMLPRPESGLPRPESRTDESVTTNLSSRSRELVCSDDFGRSGEGGTDESVTTNLSPRSRESPDAKAWERMASRSGSAPYGVLGAIALVCALRVGGEFTARTFFSVYLDSRWAVPMAQIGSALALASLLSIPAPLVTPALVRRWGRVPTIAAGALGVAASIALLGFGRNWLLASGAFVAMTVAAAMARSVWSLIVQESVSEAWRPFSAGVANLSSGLGTVLMSSVGGLLAANLGYRATFLTSAAMVALGALTVWVAFRQRVS